MCGWVTVLRGRWLNGLPSCHLQNQMSPPNTPPSGPISPTSDFQERARNAPCRTALSFSLGQCGREGGGPG